MPLPLRFHPDVENDLVDAASYYAERSPRAWLGFVEAVDEAFDRIAEMPRAAPTWPGRPDARRRLVARFPYAIVYVIEPAAIYVLTVEHVKRRPGGWLRRL